MVGIVVGTEILGKIKGLRVCPKPLKLLGGDDKSSPLGPAESGELDLPVEVSGTF